MHRIYIHTGLRLSLDSSGLEKGAVNTQGSYTNVVATHKIIRKILALPFLPAENISVMFQTLDYKAD